MLFVHVHCFAASVNPKCKQGAFTMLSRFHCATNCNLFIIFFEQLDEFTKFDKAYS